MRSTRFYSEHLICVVGLGCRHSDTILRGVMGFAISSLLKNLVFEVFSFSVEFSLSG